MRRTPQDVIDKMIIMRQRGMNITEIAEALNTSTFNVSNQLKKAGIKKKDRQIDISDLI